MSVAHVHCPYCGTRTPMLRDGLLLNCKGCHKVLSTRIYTRMEFGVQWRPAWAEFLIITRPQQRREG